MKGDLESDGKATNKDWLESGDLEQMATQRKLLHANDPICIKDDDHVDNQLQQKEMQEALEGGEKIADEAFINYSIESRDVTR